MKLDMIIHFKHHIEITLNLVCHPNVLEQSKIYVFFKLIYYPTKRKMKTL